MEVVSDYVSNFTAHIAAESDMGEAAGCDRNIGSVYRAYSWPHRT